MYHGILIAIGGTAFCGCALYLGAQLGYWAGLLRRVVKLWGPRCCRNPRRLSLKVGAARGGDGCRVSPTLDHASLTGKIDQDRFAGGSTKEELR
jgi:hypothetical protein